MIKTFYIGCTFLLSILPLWIWRTLFKFYKNLNSDVDRINFINIAIFIVFIVFPSIKDNLVVVLVTQLCLTLCDSMDYTLPGFSVHRILQARILEWIAIPFSRGSSWSRDQIRVSCIADRFFSIWASREIPKNSIFLKSIPIFYVFLGVFL